MTTATKAAAQSINSTGSGQPLEKCAPVPNRPSSGDLERGEKRLLEALVGVRAVADHPVSRPPDGRPIPDHDLIPVRHAALLRPVDPVTKSSEERFYYRQAISGIGPIPILPGRANPRAARASGESLTHFGTLPC